MDTLDFTTSTRTKGAHLTLADRAQIKMLRKLGYSMRAIAKELNCSPSTISYEIRRGTPPRNGKRGRYPQYNPVFAQSVYEQNRRRSRRPFKIEVCRDFLQWMLVQFRDRHWGLDACAIKGKELFGDSGAVCTRTLYAMLHRGHIAIQPGDCPRLLRRKRRKVRHTAVKQNHHYGRSIDERPEHINDRSEFGHWEIDTLVGQRKGKGQVLLTLVERCTKQVFVFRIAGKTSDAVLHAMDHLRCHYKKRFPILFKSITADNGSEFAGLRQLEQYGAAIYFAHPYSSWERGQNEQTNGMLRNFIPKGTPFEKYSDEQLRYIVDCINNLPRKSLGYRTAQYCFDCNLNTIY